MTTQNRTRPVYLVTTTAGFEFRTANAEDALKAVKGQLERYGYTLKVRDGKCWLTELTEAVDTFSVGEDWFYGHVRIQAVDHDSIYGHWGGSGCACPIPVTPDELDRLANAVVTAGTDWSYREARFSLATAVKRFVTINPAVTPEGAVHSLDEHALYNAFLDAAYVRANGGRLACTTTHGAMLCCGVSCAMSDFARRDGAR